MHCAEYTSARLECARYGLGSGGGGSCSFAVVAGRRSPGGRRRVQPALSLPWPLPKKHTCNRSREHRGNETRKRESLHLHLRLATCLCVGKCHEVTGRPAGRTPLRISFFSLPTPPRRLASNVSLSGLRTGETEPSWHWGHTPMTAVRSGFWVRAECCRTDFCVTQAADSVLLLPRERAKEASETKTEKHSRCCSMLTNYSYLIRHATHTATTSHACNSSDEKKPPTGNACLRRGRGPRSDPCPSPPPSEPLPRDLQLALPPGAAPPTDAPPLGLVVKPSAADLEAALRPLGVLAAEALPPSAIGGHTLARPGADRSRFVSVLLAGGDLRARPAFAPFHLAPAIFRFV